MGSDIKQFLQRLSGTGCEISQRKRTGHWVVKTPSGKQVIIPGTPHSAHRTILNSRAELRRAGVEI